MDSLNKILEKITADNNAACMDILADAKAKADAIITDAQKRAEQIKADILSDGEKQVENKLARYESSAELAYKRSMLAARVEIIDSVLKKLLESFAKMPKDEYFDLLISLVEKHADNGDAVFVLNDDDFKALPDDFCTKLGKVLENKGVVTVKGGGALPYGGFKLCYAETVLNCGFDAILSDRMDDAKDTLSEILFS